MDNPSTTFSRYRVVTATVLGVGFIIFGLIMIGMYPGSMLGYLLSLSGIVLGNVATVLSNQVKLQAQLARIEDKLSHTSVNL